VFGGRVKKWRVKQLEQPVLFLYGTGDVAFDMDSVLPATERYCKVSFTLILIVCVILLCCLEFNHNHY